MEKTITKKIIAICILVILALISILGISKIATSVQFHEKTIKALDDKKIKVVELTAGTVGASAAIAAIPGDATTPLANQIMHISSYLMLVIGAIFLEKMLLTLTGYISFTYLIPISCALYGIYIFYKKDFLKNLAIKLATFAIIIFMVVPISIKISNLVENSFKETINNTIESSKNMQDDIKNNKEENSENKDDLNWWENFNEKAKEGINNIGNVASKWIEKGKTMLSNFIDSAAVLIITSCVIPILVLFFMFWIVKIIFGINIKTNIFNNKEEKGRKDGNK